MGRRLVEAAAHVLAGSGPSALSARKVAAAAGTSTMSVYTCFGSMEVLVRAVVEEGFAMLERRLVEVEPTDAASSPARSTSRRPARDDSVDRRRWPATRCTSGSS
jgi:AcrR family transcriptional regulator